MITQATNNQGHWDHPHCTGFQQPSQDLILQHLRSLPPKPNSGSRALLINPGSALIQREVMALDYEPHCLHEWFQDHHLSQLNSNQVKEDSGQAWFDQAFSWASWTEVLQQDWDLVVVKIHKSSQWNQTLLQSLQSLGCEVLFWGANDEGMKSISKKAQKLGWSAEVLAMKKSCRIVSLQSGGTFEKSLKPSKMESLIEYQKFKDFRLKSYVGCFGHGKSDQGTEVLMEVLRSEQSTWGPLEELQVLDLGCGAGVLSRWCLESGLEQIISRDAHSLAMESLALNVPLSEVSGSWGFMADGLDSKVDIILTNPPFHIGTQTEIQLGEMWLQSLNRALRPQGVVYLVCNSFLDYPKLAKAQEFKIELLQKSCGFSVYKLIK